MVSNKIANENLRQGFLELIKEYFLEDKYEILQHKSNAICTPCVDENGDEINLCAEIYPSPEFAENKDDEELKKYFKSKIVEVLRSLPSYKQIANIVIRREEFPHTTSRKIKRMEVLKEKGDRK